MSFSKNKEKEDRAIQPDEKDGSISVENAILPEVEDFEKKYSEVNDKYLRIAAEFENYRKRQEKILAQLIEQERNNIIGRLLEVANDIDRAISEIEKGGDPNAIYEGIKLVARRIQDLLKREGIEPDDPTGKPFDPLEHEAIAIVPVENPEQDNIVVQIIQPCYRRDGKLVCHAKVIVGKLTDTPKDEINNTE